jgi:hypothetical protein
MTYFVLEKEKGHAYIYSHHVVASKFPEVQKTYHKKGGVIIYNVLDNMYEQIKGIMDEYSSSEDNNEDHDSEDE